jgi:hypothetical protein
MYANHLRQTTEMKKNSTFVYLWTLICPQLFTYGSFAPNRTSFWNIFYFTQKCKVLQYVSRLYCWTLRVLCTINYYESRMWRETFATRASHFIVLDMKYIQFIVLIDI